jgi:hypothetical protein
MPLLRRVLPLTAILPAFLAVGCASHPKGDGGTISEVKYYHLKTTTPPRTPDPMILSEPLRLLYGAVQPSDIASRFGHYYSVFWKVKDRTRPVVIEFEYKQIKEPTKVRKLVVTTTEPSRSNKTDFRIIGAPYYAQGRIYAWRASLSQGGRLLDTYESYLWSRTLSPLPSEVVLKRPGEFTTMPADDRSALPDRP